MKTVVKLFVFILISNVCVGQNSIAKIDSILKENYKKYPEVSISVGYIERGNEYYINYGNIRKGSTKAVDKNTVFEIASITKAITGNLIAQAANEGKLKLNGYIEDYLPKDFILQKHLRNKITISDLASHQSGLDDIDWRQLMAKNPKEPMKDVTRQTFIDIITNCNSLKDYGNYRYSTIGFVLLGEILENVYQKSYDAIVREKMIDPLQMRTTFTKEFAIKNIVTGYNRKGTAQKLFQWNSSAAAGLLKTCTADMILYLKEILHGNTKLAAASTTTENVFYKAKDGLRKIGLGINVYIDDTDTYFLKTGDSMGQSSVMGYNKKDNWGIIILINQQNPKMRKELWNAIYDEVLK